jgi:hypothetical protein
MAALKLGETQLMIQRLAGLGAILLLAACSTSKSQQDSKPIDRVFVEDERSPEKSAGWCNKCNMSVYSGHRCGLTAPCALCQREAGARHLHEVEWYCSSCDIMMSKHHECVDAKTCPICRQDKNGHRSQLGTTGCERCARQVPPTRLVGLTTYCGQCNQEVGANHVHGKTVYCLKCLHEAGKNHVCDATRFCYEHGMDEAVDHVHGTTVYCELCHREAGQNHKHGITEWCWVCYAEKEWPHSNHK